jgi:hypothetical protein
MDIPKKKRIAKDPRVKFEERLVYKPQKKKSPPNLTSCFVFAERKGFEPSIPFRGIHTFQACSFNHSDTSL